MRYIITARRLGDHRPGLPLFAQRLADDLIGRAQNGSSQQDSDDQVGPSRAGQPHHNAGRGDREALDQVVARSSRALIATS
jgi:hypothetical protein